MVRRALTATAMAMTLAVTAAACSGDAGIGAGDRTEPVVTPGIDQAVATTPAITPQPTTT